MSAHETENVGIHLDSPISCREELQRVANGIASLTVDHTKLLEEGAELEDQWELVEAAAFNGVRTTDKGLTATQVKSLAVEAISMSESANGLRKRLRIHRAALEANDRRLRSLEKRLMAAMSALKDHQGEAMSAGYAGG